MASGHPSCGLARPRTRAGISPGVCSATLCPGILKSFAAHSVGAFQLWGNGILGMDKLTWWRESKEGREVWERAGTYSRRRWAH